MHTNFIFKPCSLFTLDLHCCFSFLVHFHQSSHFWFHHPFLPQRPPDYFPWHTMKSFSQTDERYNEIFSSRHILLYQLCHSKYGVICVFPGMNLIWMSLMVIAPRIFLSKAISIIFIACSSIFRLL